MYVRTLAALALALYVLPAAHAAPAQSPTIIPIVKSIKITGSAPIPAATVQGLMKTKPGRKLDISLLMQDVQAIQNHYKQRGYIAAVTGEMGVSEKTGVLTVPILVSKVGQIDLPGASKSNTKSLLAGMKTKVGGFYNAQTLKQDVRRLKDSGKLREVKQEKVTSSAAKPGLVRITVPVVEKRTG